MEPFEWEPENYDGGEDYSEEWGDSEAFPGLPRPFSPSAALARRLYPPRRRQARTPPRRMVSVAAAATPATALRQLEQRQQSVASQLALMQQRVAARQSSDQFGPMATGAVAALALGYKSNDLFTPALVSGLPLAQLLLQTRGQAISAGFAANPMSTLLFPSLAAALVLFRDKIPGLAPTVVAAPEVDFAESASGKSYIVRAKAPTSGAVLRSEGPPAASLGEPPDPTSTSDPFPGSARLTPGQVIKFRAFVGEVGSAVIRFKAPAPES